MLKRNLLFWIFLLLLVTVPFGLLTFGETLDPFSISTNLAYQSPSETTPFGTDALGRNMLARTIYATGLSLKVTVHALFIAFGLAVLFGGVAGYTHGKIMDRIISWVIALIYTVPFILIVVAVFAVLEPGIERAYIVIGCLGWVAPARLIRAEVIQYRTALFVTAERALGYSPMHILFRSIIPLSFLPALLSLLYFIPELIGVEVGLSFFGLGAQPPIPSLGRLIYDGLSDFYTGWWLSLIPSGVLLIVVGTIYAVTHKIGAVTKIYR